MVMPYLLFSKVTSSLEGSLVSWEGEWRDRVHEEDTCYVRRKETSACLSMGNIGRKAWVSPLRKAQRYPLTHFSRKHACSRTRGLFGEPKWGRVYGEDTHCIGSGKTSTCLSMGNVRQKHGWAPGVSLDIAYWHVLPRWHSCLRARGLLNESR